MTESSGDERAGNLLRQMKFGVFGLGNSVYPKNYFNRVSRTLDRFGERGEGRGEEEEGEKGKEEKKGKKKRK